jgi:hypothetical protein
MILVIKQAAKEIRMKKAFKTSIIRIQTSLIANINAMIALTKLILDLKHNQDYSVIESPFR